MLYQSAKKYRAREFDGKIKSGRKTQFQVHLFVPEIEVDRVDTAELICKSQINGQV